MLPRSLPAETDASESAARKVLCLAARAADVARVAAEQRARGAEVRVVALERSEAVPEGSAPRPAALGGEYELAARVAREVEAFAPQLVCAPSVLEPDPGRRATASATAAALAGRVGVRAQLYGVDAELPGGAVELDAAALLDWTRRERPPAALDDPWAATAVISTWNKLADLCANLDGLRAQTRPFSEVVVVDNASKDGTARALRERYPEVRLMVMPHSAYGACETFNIGFASVVTPLTAILDDDVVLPPDWLEKTVARLQREPASTAIVSSEVEEPGMPPGYLEREHLRRERYMSTFRGCASLARSEALRRAGYYDERLFIYGNERDLTCRLLNLGYRVLQYPEARAFHKTPFGIKMGKRSLYYHARNAWLTQLKYAPAGDLARLPWLVLTRVLLRGQGREEQGEVSDATGTIGIGKSVRQTPGAAWVLARAGLSVLANLPYCWKHRAPCRASDFELPLR